MNFDRTIDLCLACSSSLPPSRSSDSKATIFFTQCCNKPICPTCISGNPRLARYNPCLRCLGGVGVVTARSSPKGTTTQVKPQNLDGGIHDDEVFTLGDDDEDDESEPESESFEGGQKTPSTPPPAYIELEEVPSDAPNVHEQDTIGDTDRSPEAPEASEPSSAPSEYYIQPKDTLVGIALRFGVDGRLLCRLNGLPPSTLRTTPHLLHTRTVLKLPPSARKLASPTVPSWSSTDPEREARRARERAEKRFQTVTKETDWRIAKAYVALAEDVEHEPLSKEEMSKMGRRDSTAEGRAMDQYLDDEEWEAKERQEGRGVQIPKFPLASQSNAQKGKDSTSRWRWRK